MQAATMRVEGARDATLHDLTDNNQKRKIFSFVQNRYKETCLTCKIRKKKCSKERPICADCKRLDKCCVWIDDSMSIQEIRELKHKVENNEKEQKLKRKLDVQVKKIAGYKKRKNDQPAGSVLEASVGEFNVLEFGTQPKKEEITEKHQGYDGETGKFRNTSTNTLNVENTVTPTSLKDSGITMQLGPTYINQDQHGNQDPSHASDAIAHSHSWNFLNSLNSFMNESHSTFNIPSLSPKIEHYDTENTSDHNTPNINENLVLTNSRPSFNYHANLDHLPFTTFPSSLEEFCSRPFLNLRKSYSIPKSLSPEKLDLDETGMFLLDHYKNRMLNVLCLCPSKSTHYRRLYLPLASVNRGILYALLAWSASYKGKGYEAEVKSYMDKSLEFMEKKPLENESDRVQKLVNCMILMTTQICEGDVNKWGKYLKMSAETIKQNGGIFSINNSKEENFLISSFSYHDMHASSISERGTYFPIEDYERMLLNVPSEDADPLQGVARPIFHLIGQISSLAAETKRVLKSNQPSLTKNMSLVGYTSGRTVTLDNSEPAPKYLTLMEIMDQSSLLADKIDNVRADPVFLGQFTPRQLELQLTLFELFQHTAKLHLRQSVLRLNPCSLETQYILCELLKSVEILLNTQCETSLCFPMFIAGINCVSECDRNLVSDIFDDLIDRWEYRNLARAKEAVQKVWELNPTGAKYIDWYDLMKDLEWDLSFA